MNEYWQGFWEGILIWLLVAWLLKQLIIMAVVKAVKSHMEENPEETTEEVLLTIEKHHDMLYCYRKDTDQFVCQGKTLQEIADKCVERFPNIKGRILKEDSAGLL